MDWNQALEDAKRLERALKPFQAAVPIIEAVLAASGETAAAQERVQHIVAEVDRLNAERGRIEDVLAARRLEIEAEIEATSRHAASTIAERERVADQHYVVRREDRERTLTELGRQIESLQTSFTERREQLRALQTEIERNTTEHRTALADQERERVARMTALGREEEALRGHVVRLRGQRDALQHEIQTIAAVAGVPLAT